MNGIRAVLRALHEGEHRLERDLLTAADRHRADHEIHHVATDIARWSREHTERLADAGRHYDLDLSGAHEPAPGLWAGLREKTGEALGRRPEPGLLLLHDLSGLHLTATENSLNWEMLAQAAQATSDHRLLGLATACHPQTLRQMRWTNTMIKTLAPQSLTSM
ncbi:hypothetical protein [Kitasatospora sp. NPDC008115]|uniref:hypothetical protein n=1 Tax=Kitasatospora sp. NPDC008115 TaxID=3364022 RepID=UPI0036EC3127